MWRLAVLLFVASLCTVAISTPLSTVNVPGSSTRIVFDDSQAAITVLPHRHNNTRSYVLRFSHLVEADATETLPAQQATFDQAITYSDWAVLQNDSSNVVQSMNMTTNVSLPGNIMLPVRIKYYLFLKETKIQQGTELIKIETGSLKFTFEMEKWPFKDSKNFVFLHTFVSSTELVSFSADLRPSGQVRRLSVRPTAAHNDSLFIQFPITGMIDKSNQHVDIKVDAGADAAIIDLVFAFPFFNDAISYDPDVGVEYIKAPTPLEPSPPGLPLPLILTLIAISVALGIFGLVLAIQSYRRWRLQKRYLSMI